MLHEHAALIHPERLCGGLRWKGCTGASQSKHVAFYRVCNGLSMRHVACARSPEEPVKELWRLDLKTRRWSEPEQHGTRPCARMMTHGVPSKTRSALVLPFPVVPSPEGQKDLSVGTVFTDMAVDTPQIVSRKVAHVRACEHLTGQLYRTLAAQRK